MDQATVERRYITDEHQMIIDSARQFTLEEVLPVANELDPVQGEIPDALRQKLADMGYFGIHIPEAYGSSGLGCFEYCLVTEQLARGWMSVASIIARGNGTLTMELLSEERKAKMLPRVAEGAYLDVMSLSEPDTGSDLASIYCRAERDGADYIVLFARSTPPPDEQKRHLGISAFIIDKQRGTLPDGIHGSEIPKIGYFGWKTWGTRFRRVPPAGRCVDWGGR